ncbi:MAG: ParA family protein [Verrucomicrobiales bacterium]
MISIAVVSQKGGVGKTTTALNLAYSFAKREWQTLLVDLDPQGSVGFSLSEKAQRASGLVEFMAEEDSLANLSLNTVLPKLKILTFGAGEGLNYDQTKIDQTSLSGLLAEAEKDGVEIVLFDTPSGGGPATMAALRTADMILAPQQAEPLSIRSVAKLLDILSMLSEEDGRDFQLAVLVTMLDSRQSESMQVTQELWNALPAELVLDTVIPREPIFLEASAKGVPLALLRQNPPAAAIVFDQVAAELESRLGLASKSHEHKLLAFLD